jgi:hypothetical protein
MLVEYAASPSDGLVSKVWSEHKEKPDRKGRNGGASKSNWGCLCGPSPREQSTCQAGLSLASRPATYPGVHVSYRE